jgi:ABC-type transporter Mla subunit MlaD
MTDKELRKLSRLELLELLLEATKENQKLKDTIKKMKIENQTAQSIENLSTATHKVESALKYANSLTDTLKGTAKDSVQINKNTSNNINQVKNDREIYWRMMAYFSKNNHLLTLLPDDLRNDISERIKEVLQQIRK